jgi:hypothetical protein
MPTMNGRYGRPKGSGLSVAALLAANPKLKPTTAIRSLDVEDPSAIRRLRDNFRVEQSKLMADARRAVRANGARSRPRTSAAKASPIIQRAPTPEPGKLPIHSDPPRDIVASTMIVAWYDLGFCALRAAVEGQSVLTQHWLSLPPVSMALRGQLTLNAIALAVYNRGRPRRSRLH